MDYGAYKFWFDVAQTLALAAIGLHQYLINRQRVTARTLSELRAHIDRSIEKLEVDMAGKREAHARRLGDLDGELNRINGELKHAPNHDDLKRIHHRLDTNSTQLAEISGTVRAMNGTLGTIHEFLLNGGKQ